MNDIFLKSFEKKINLYLSSSKNIYYRVKKNKDTEITKISHLIF